MDGCYNCAKCTYTVFDKNTFAKTRKEESYLKIRDLSVKFDQKTVLDGFNFEFKDGESLALTALEEK